MPDLKKILDQVHTQCTQDNCQSWNTICLLAMQQSVDEQRVEFIDKFDKLINDPSSTKEDFIKLLNVIEVG